MSIRTNLEEVIDIFEKIKHYDADQCSYQLLMWAREMKYFYNTLVESTEHKDPSKTFFNVRSPIVRPNEGQIAYFNLRRGYSKEIYDGHYCYIFKDVGMKYVVIPTTSVKEDSAPMDPRFEFDIDVENFINTNKTRLQFSDMRSVDLQRYNGQKGVYNVSTQRNNIIGKFNDFLGLTEVAAGDIL